MPQKNKFVRNNSRGFTLIELLMVIAIIGILAAIIMVNMSGMRAKANKINAFSALKSAAEAATMCLTNGGALLNAPGKTGGGDFYSGGNAGILAAAGGNGFICKDGSPEKYSDISD